MYVETNDGKKLRAVTDANGRLWCEGNVETIIGPVAEGVNANNYPWSQRSFTGDKVSPRNTDYQGMTCLQSFEMMMPPKQIKLILELTNEILNAKGKTELTHGELFRYFGVCMLMALSKLLVPAMMETIHSSGGYAVVWRDLDAGQSTARLCMLILQTCIELYNYMVRYNKTLILYNYKTII